MSKFTTPIQTAFRIDIPRLLFAVFLLLSITACRPTAQPESPTTPPTEAPEELPDLSTPTDNPPTGFDPSSPPPAVLHVGELAQTGGIGSYCWTDPTAGFGICADTMGIPTPVEPLIVSSPLLGSFELAVPGSPQELVLSVFPVGDKKPAFARDDALDWEPIPITNQISLPLVQVASFRLELDPGQYVLSIFARWPTYGDVTYGFLVTVE